MIRTATFTAIAVVCLAYTAAGAPIHDAVTAGDLEAVQTLVAADPSLVSAPDSALNLPLHLAALAGSVDVIECLIEHGAEVDAGDRENTRPLGCAALRGNYEAAVALVNHGASIELPDDFGTTPILHAFQGGSEPLIRFLLDRGASLEGPFPSGGTPLHGAAGSGNLSLVQLCLDHGMDVAAHDRNGYTPLHWAAFRNRPEAIRLLMAKGAQMDQSDNANRFTPLALTAMAGSLEAARVLLELGADLNCRSEQQQTLLHLSAERGHIEAVAFWAERGIDVNALDKWGGTALNYSARSHVEMTRWLLSHGANPNAIVDTAIAPLYFAAAGGDTANVRALVDAGADVNTCGRDDDPPLHVAIRRGQNAIIDMLIDAGADPNKGEPHYAQTPLHLAVLAGNRELAATLLDRGADYGIKDLLGHTPLDYATRYGHPTCSELLIERGAPATDPAGRTDSRRALNPPPAVGQASVWYLGHSGWAIRTTNHFLIFDYHEMNGHPDVRSIANGFIEPSEIANLPVTVLSSHEHRDHYDTLIFGWRDRVAQIDYILGHQPTDRQGYTYIEPHQTQDVNGVRVTTIRSTDAGVGYLVEVDGLTIYHAGDHSAGTVDLPEAFCSEVTFLAERWPQVDMAFLPISGCSLGTPESVQAGDIHTLDKLHPKVTFPQHSMNAEYHYTEFKERAVREGVADSILCAQFRGDMFTYDKNASI